MDEGYKNAGIMICENVICSYFVFSYLFYESHVFYCKCGVYQDWTTNSTQSKNYTKCVIKMDKTVCQILSLIIAVLLCKHKVSNILHKHKPKKKLSLKIKCALFFSSFSNILSLPVAWHSASHQKRNVSSERKEKCSTYSWNYILQ